LKLKSYEIAIENFNNLVSEYEDLKIDLVEQPRYNQFSLPHSLFAMDQEEEFPFQSLYSIPTLNVFSLELDT